LNSSEIELSQIKLVIGATNVGEDKYDPGPLIRQPFEIHVLSCVMDCFSIQQQGG